MNTHELTAYIKNKALALGFDACGIAAAKPLSETDTRCLKQWLSLGFHGDMGYMERNLDKRLDPTKLIPGAKSIVVVALNYATSNPPSGIARFALRPDYHTVIRMRLNTLLQDLQQNIPEVTGRAFSDSAPLTERYWAQEAGLGWIGRNRLLIVPGKGSWYMLGVLIINQLLEYDQPVKNRCGTCKRCVDACPGQALSSVNGLDVRRCLSYLTIEKKGILLPDEMALLEKNSTFFGCDSCQQVCPWNRFSTDQLDEKYPLLTQLTDLDLNHLSTMNDVEFKDYFRKTCLERTGLETLQRNAYGAKKKPAI